MNTACKYCNNLIVETFYFCPTCGKKIKEPPFKFSLKKSISIIIMSILFPPFGIIPGIKYFLKDNREAQIVGMITIGITIIATVILIIFTVRIINNVPYTYQQLMNIQNTTIDSPQTNNQEKLLNQIQELQ